MADSEKCGDDRNTKMWISCKPKESLRWNKKLFS